MWVCRWGRGTGRGRHYSLYTVWWGLSSPKSWGPRQSGTRRERQRQGAGQGGGCARPPPCRMNLLKEETEEAGLLPQRTQAGDGGGGGAGLGRWCDEENRWRQKDGLWERDGGRRGDQRARQAEGTAPACGRAHARARAHTVFWRFCCFLSFNQIVHEKQEEKEEELRPTGTQPYHTCSHLYIHSQERPTQKTNAHSSQTPQGTPTHIYTKYTHPYTQAYVGIVGHGGSFAHPNAHTAIHTGARTSE